MNPRTVFMAVWRTDKADGRTAPTLTEGTGIALAQAARQHHVPCDLHDSDGERRYAGEIDASGNIRYGALL